MSQRCRCVQTPECLKVTVVAMTDEPCAIHGLTRGNLFLLHAKLYTCVPDWRAALPRVLIQGPVSFHLEAAPPVQGDFLGRGGVGRTGKVAKGKVSRARPGRERCMSLLPTALRSSVTWLPLSFREGRKVWPCCVPRGKQKQVW